MLMKQGQSSLREGGERMKEVEKIMLNGEDVELKQYVKQSELISLKAQGVQQVPLFANSIDECTDVSKLYVLPDGYIYYYSDGSETILVHTNKIPLSVSDDGEIYNEVGYRENVRYSTSEKIEKVCGSTYITGWIYVTPGDVVRFKNMPISTLSDADAMKNAIYCANEAKSTQWTLYSTIIQENLTGCEVDEGGNVSQFTVSSGCNWIRFASTWIDGNSIVTVNEKIVSASAEKGLHNTGHAFVPADYEDRIVALENILLGTVHGIVDEENNILLSGDLEKGTYSLAYIDANGASTKIGTFEVE